MQKARLEPVDSDLDLHEDQHGAGSPPAGYEVAGAITPAMLAKFHLPDVVLNHGPMSIRHMLGCLTVAVPGFAAIPPAKARRLVVAALEGRGNGGGRGGVDGDVEFIKVGWGTWDARRKNQPGCVPSGAGAQRRSSPHNLTPNFIPISKGAGRKAIPTRLAASGSSAGGAWSAAFSHDDRSIHMPEHEADNMSLDGSGSASCSEAPDDDVVMNDDPEDVTDEEDWAAVGAAALRASSYQARSGRDGFSGSVYTSGAGFGSLSATAGMARPPQFRNIDFSASACGPSDAQEREAVEALLRLGSV